MSRRPGGQNAGRMARATLGTQLFIAATLITILVMAVLASIITWQNRQTACAAAAAERQRQLDQDRAARSRAHRARSEGA